jgi:hypothetical protein
VAGSCEHSNEHPLSIGGEDFLDLLIYSHLLKNDSAPWSYLIGCHASNLDGFFGTI